MPPTDADLRDKTRADVENEHSALRDAREKQHVEDKRLLEEDYQSDLVVLRENREAALIAADLNPDGSDPQGRPQGT